MHIKKLLLVTVFLLSFAIVPLGASSNVHAKEASIQDQVNDLISQIIPLTAKANSLIARIKELMLAKLSQLPAQAQSGNNSSNAHNATHDASSKKNSLNQSNAQETVLPQNLPQCYDFNANIGYKTTDPDVLNALETALSKEGINYDYENPYDDTTAAAVSLFQAKYGITQTGYVGTSTRAELNKLYGCSAALNLTDPSASKKNSADEFAEQTNKELKKQQHNIDALNLTNVVTILTHNTRAHAGNKKKNDAQLKDVLKKRAAAMIGLMEESPEAAQANLLPGDVQSDAAKVSPKDVETKVTLTGMYQSLHTERFHDSSQTLEFTAFSVNEASGPTTYYLSSTQELPHIHNQTKMTVTGLKLGSRILVDTVMEGNAITQSNSKAIGFLKSIFQPSFVDSMIKGYSKIMGFFKSVGSSIIAYFQPDFAKAALPSTLRIKVIPVTFTDTTNPTTIYNMTKIHALLNGTPGDDVESYYKEVSYNKVSITTEAVGPYALSMTKYDGCKNGGDAAIAGAVAAADASIDYSQVDEVIVDFDCPDAGATALGSRSFTTNDGTFTMLLATLNANYANDKYGYIHETGHNIALPGNHIGHSNWYLCLPYSFLAPDNFQHTCISRAYGDEFDAMDGTFYNTTTPHMNAYHKLMAGWLTSLDYVTLSAPGTYTQTIAPIEGTTGVRGVEVIRGTSKTSFLIEYRQPIGLDSWLTSPTYCPGCTVTDGPSIKFVYLDNTGDTQSIDTTPYSRASRSYAPVEDYWNGAALEPGSTFSDPDSGITINAISADASGTTVEITIPSGTCTRAPETVSVSPLNPVLTPGVEALFTETIKNNDSADCPLSIFRGGGSYGYAGPDITLAPGATGTINLYVTPPATSLAGDKYVSASASSSTLGSVAVNKTFQYQIVSPADTTPPSAPSNLTANAFGAGGVVLSWTASTDNVELAGYKIFRDGSTIVTLPASATSYTDYFLSPIPSRTFSYYVQAFDRQGNTTNSTTVSVATPAQTDTTPPSVVPPISYTFTKADAITLNWSPATDNVGVYAYQVTSYATLGIVPANVNTFNVKNLGFGRSWNFSIYALDADGNHQLLVPSDTLITAKQGTLPPTPPANPTSSAANACTVHVAWSPSTDDTGVANYDVYQNGLLKATVTGTSYDVTNQLDGAGLQYYVQARDLDGNLSSPIYRMPFVVTPRAATITSPVSSAYVSGNVNITTNIDAACVSKVDFYVDGVFLSEDTTFPFSAVWDTTGLAVGTSHRIVARPYDMQGNNTQLDGINTVYIGSSLDTTPPTSSVTAPADGSTVSGTVSVTATASDNVGVTKVEFYVDGVLKSTDTSSPYSFSWDTTAVSNSSHTLVAKAYDAANNIGASSTISVTVNNVADTTPPTVSITAPTNGSTVSGTTIVTASASDNVSVASVEFYVDSVLKSTSTVSPYSYSWNTTGATNGSHNLTAKAYDTAGNVGTSANVTVAVSNITSDTTPPAVSITSPSNGSTVSGTVSVTATASDNVGVTKVELYVDSVLTSTSTISPYSFSLDTTALTNGSHNLTAKAYDAAGNVGTSATVTITVSNIVLDTTPPSVPSGLTSSSTTGTSTTLSWGASTDNVGVTGYNIFRNGLQFATSSTASYTDSALVSCTTYSYYVQAYDAAGNVSSSSNTINIQTAGCANTTIIPTIVITSPANGAVISSKGTTKVSVTASDANGIKTITIAIDGATKATCSGTTTCMYIITNSKIAKGAHTIVSQAIGNEGNSASANIGVTK